MERRTNRRIGPLLIASRVVFFPRTRGTCGGQTATGCGEVFQSRQRRVWGVEQLLRRRRKFWMAWRVRALRFATAAGIAASQAGAATFIVNSADDSDDFDPNSGITTLRKALRESDFTAGETNQIRFNISDFPHILVNGSFGSLGAVKPVVIDGTTQPGGILVLDGSMAGSFDPGGGELVGLDLTGAGITVRGLVIENFAFDGIRIRPSGAPVTGNDVIVGNTIKGNGRHGVNILNASSNLVGGSIEADWNIIGENKGDGVHITGSDAGGNRVQGNGIGRNSRPGPTVDDRSNEGDGIVVEDAPDTVIGDTEQVDQPGPTANKIIGKKRGVRIEGPLATNTSVNGNFIGEQAIQATLEAGVFSRGGNLLSISGDVFTKVGGTEIDVFADFDGKVDIRHNVLNAQAVLGVDLGFGEGRDVTIEYRNNLIRNAQTGLHRVEALSGKFTWLASDNDTQSGGPAYSLVFRGNVVFERSFVNDTVNSTGEVGVIYVYHPSADLNATLSFSGLTASGAKGGMLGTIEAGAGLTIDLVGGSRMGGQGSGDKLTVGATVTGSVTFHSKEVTRSLCAEAGLFLENRTGRTSLCTAFLEHDSDLGNIVGLNLLNWKLGRSVDSCVINNNSAAGIQIQDGTDADIHDCTLEDNGTAVLVLDNSHASVENCTITGNGTGLVTEGTGVLDVGANAIFGNRGLGIDLGNDGVTPNDLGDLDQIQNFPVLTSAFSDLSSLTVNGILNSRSNQTFTLFFFANTICNPSGFGEGELFIGSIPVSTDSAGNAPFAMNFPVPVPVGGSITATATGDRGTSEFSQCVVVSSAAGGGIITVAVDKPSQTAQYSDPISPVSISASDPSAIGSSLQARASFEKDGGSSQNGLPTGLSLVAADSSSGPGLPGIRVWTVLGRVLTAPGKYVIRVDVTDGGTGSGSFNVIVTQEDAQVQYNGQTQFTAALPLLAETVDSLVSQSFTGFRLNRFTHTFDTVGVVQNTTKDVSIFAPASLVITKISDPTITLANPTGVTADGLPFVQLQLANAFLAPGEAITDILLKFNNPNLVPLTFETSVRANVPDFNNVRANLRLEATLGDEPDGFPGDVRTATVTFYRNSSADPANILGTPNSAAELIDPTDPTRGIAATTLTYTLSTDEAKKGLATFPVITVAGGNYQGQAAAQTITISTQPSPVEFVSRQMSNGVTLESFLIGASTPRQNVLRVRIKGAAGQTYSITRSSDLVTWWPVMELYNATGVVEFSRAVQDVEPQQFFRVNPLGERIGQRKNKQTREEK